LSVKETQALKHPVLLLAQIIRERQQIAGMNKPLLPLHRGAGQQGSIAQVIVVRLAKDFAARVFDVDGSYFEHTEARPHHPQI